ncbi:glycosyltransferase family 2 protein [Candidatus Woesearchaeota archaeon]|nr:glycosyltransferase family 2 protein [Candidatus Woesearchaeota archaeon]
MEDPIMIFSSVLFGIVLSFLAFLFAVFVISRFIKRENVAFEPKVSVVVPAYNEGKNIGECLDAVFASNYPQNKLEVIVVDDGSNDNTLKILEKYKKARILKQNHLGKVEALNNGIINSSNEFVLTLDADTTMDKKCIMEIVKPFLDKSIGATTGNNNIKNKKSVLSMFQNIEYHFTNLMRSSFSAVFKQGAWISGSLACYRKSALKKIGYFKKDTMAEDIDIALELKKAGYKTVIVPAAFGHTIVPTRLKELYRQRVRWWVGTLQAIIKNRQLFSTKSAPSILYLYISHFWWSFYAFLSLPIIIYQIHYWLPYNTQSLFSLGSYFFRWFSLMGPIYVLYKIPNFGVSLYSIFGVLAGIIMTVISIAALKIFKDRLSFKNIFAIFFYFPYTIVLNIIILVSMLNHRFWERSFYIK